MAPYVIQGVAQGGRWALGRLFAGGVGRAAAPAVRQTAMSQVRRQADEEARTRTNADSQACATCRPPRCAELEREMRQIIERRRGVDGNSNRGLREQAENFVNPRRPLDQQEVAGGGRGRRPGGHLQSWRDAQNSIHRKKAEWDRLGCGPLPPDIEQWSTMDPPGPGGVIPP